MAPYRPRLVERQITELFTELPALMLVGPRAVGKTTTASRFAATVVRLDVPGEAVAFRADPDAALSRLDRPVLIDEWQMVPDVLGAVKRAVDAGASPGSFLLAGSVSADLESASWPATGRIERISMYGLTVREQLGRPDGPTFLDAVATGIDAAGITAASEPPDLAGYVDLALAGGFPDSALQLSGPARRRWLAGYVDSMLTRDFDQELHVRDPGRVRRFMEAFALNSAGSPADVTLFEAAGINRQTALRYERVLQNLMVIDQVPAWSTNRLARLARSPKRYVVDSALMGAVLGMDAVAVLRDGDVLGRLIDTFVVSQLRAEIEASTVSPRLYHLRDTHGRREIDVLAELGADRVVAIEVKAGTAPDRSDARHLIWLRERLGDRFVAGVVFHTGPSVYGLAEGIVAAPICALWS